MSGRGDARPTAAVPGRVVPGRVSGYAPSAHLVWGAAVAAYAVAVLHRSSLGVAGVQAVDRFDVGAAVLSTFVVVQLAVYAGMQVPVGVLLDRYGSRVLIAGGAVLMAVGQVLLGVVDDLPSAYLARVLIGAGDAATFISVIRLVAVWFPARRVPLFTQLTGIVGNLGQLAAAIPLVAVLDLAGWSPAFVGLGAIGALAAILAWAVVRDRPAGRRHEPSALSVRHHLRAAVRTPGTWLGFWSHALAQFPMAVFLLLWGFPFLTVAQGLSPARAGALMSLSVVAAVISGPVIGVLTGRHPLRRSWMVLTIAVATAMAWTAVLVQSGAQPALAAGGARRRAGCRRAGVGDRVRLRPHVQPGRPARHGERPGEHRRLLDGGRHDARRRHRAGRCRGGRPPVAAGLPLGLRRDGRPLECRGGRRAGQSPFHAAGDARRRCGGAADPGGAGAAAGRACDGC